MDTSAKSLSTQSLEIKSNTSSNHESSNQHHQSTNSLGLDQQLRDHRDYIDDRMREFEERLVSYFHCLSDTNTVIQL